MNLKKIAGWAVEIAKTARIKGSSSDLK